MSYWPRGRKRNDHSKNHQEFCKAVARVCREYKMQNVELKYWPGFEDTVHSAITMNWAQGRHGEDSGKIVISLSMQVNTKIDLPKEQP